MQHKETKGVIIDEHKKLHYGSMPLRELGENDVLVKIHSAPINPSDVLFTQGIYPAGKHFPTTVGFEGSGLVIATGTSDHAKSLANKRVTFFASGAHDLGSWTEQAVLDSTTVFPIPGDLSYEEACNCLVNPLSVQGMIYTCIKKGHKAIVHAAAASNLGRMLIVACKQAKIDLINIVRREEQVKLLKDLGAEHVLNSTSEAYQTDLSYQISVFKPSAFFDPIGGKDGSIIFSHMPSHSTTYCYGALAGADYNISVTDLIFKQKVLTGFWVSEILKDSEAGPQVVAGAFGSLATRQWTTAVSKKFPLDHFKEALEHYAKHSTEGKVLLQNPHFESK